MIPAGLRFGKKILIGSKAVLCYIITPCRFS